LSGLQNIFETSYALQTQHDYIPQFCYQFFVPYPEHFSKKGTLRTEFEKEQLRKLLVSNLWGKILQFTETYYYLIHCKLLPSSLNFNFTLTTLTKGRPDQIHLSPEKKNKCNEPVQRDQSSTKKNTQHFYRLELCESIF